MKTNSEDVGQNAHKEELFVFLTFGAALGVIAAVVEIRWGRGNQVLNVANEALAPRIFLMLCVIAIGGLVIASLERTPFWMKRKLRCAASAGLRAGLSAGFIAAGMTLGVGMGAWPIFECCGTSKQVGDAWNLVILGAVFLLPVSILMFVGAQVLDRASFCSRVVATLCCVCIGAVLIKSFLS